MHVTCWKLKSTAMWELESLARFGRDAEVEADNARHLSVIPRQPYITLLVTLNSHTDGCRPGSRPAGRTKFALQLGQGHPAGAASPG